MDGGALANLDDDDDGDDDMMMMLDYRCMQNRRKRLTFLDGVSKEDEKSDKQKQSENAQC